MRNPRDRFGAFGILAGLAVAAATGAGAIAQGHGSHGGGGSWHPGRHHHHPSPCPYPPYVVGVPFFWPAPVVVGPVAPLMPPTLIPSQFNTPPVIAADPLLAMNPASVALPPRVRPRDPSRARELVVQGDRQFRAKNVSHAIDRYESAVKTDPDRAEPRIRLALISLWKGKYRESAARLREAIAAEPTWLLGPDPGVALDMFPEPSDLDRLIADTESHLQAHPEDRDAWLSLGALHYFSGQVQKAGDCFLRLADRQGDPTLKAFLSATKADDREP